MKNYKSRQGTSVVHIDSLTRNLELEQPSLRKTLYPMGIKDPVNYLKSIYSEDEKGMLSEYGWIFLINDAGDYLDYAFGKEKWSDEDISKAINIFKKREIFIQEKKTKYIKLIIPEKIAVYSEYLPKILTDTPLNETRPAVILAKHIENVFYLDRYLIDLKPYGRLYFRSDTHTNWLGAYFIYVLMWEKLGSMDMNIGNVISLKDLKPSIAKYCGDLYTQMKSEMMDDLHSVWKNYNLDDALAYDIKYALPDTLIKTRLCELDEFYEKYTGHRPVLVYEHEDTTLPTCVVFRDSTADNIVDLLAQHFSRSVFIWKEGNVFEEIVDREKPDIIIHLMAERFVSDYPTKKVPFVTQSMFEKVYRKA